MNRIGNGSTEQEHSDTAQQQAEDSQKTEAASSSELTSGSNTAVIAQEQSEGADTADVHGCAPRNGTESFHEQQRQEDAASSREDRRQNERSPPKKRLRASHELPQVVLVASRLPPPPLVGTHHSAILTESPADAAPIQSTLQPRMEETMETPQIKNPPRETVVAAAAAAAVSSPHASPSSSQSPTSPSSHRSEASPLPPPPAPPSTPASGGVAATPFEDLATPRPSYDVEDEDDNDDTEYAAAAAAGVMKNARVLEQKERAQATPAPRRKKKAAGPALVEDFSDWAVGDRYELIRILGRGSYGEVAQAKDLLSDNNFVAIKRITSAFDQEVDAIRLYREMHILRRLRGHECIIQLLDVVQPPTDDLDDFHDLYLVFEYVDTDLYKLIMSPQYLTTEHIQTFLYQMLAGLKFIHSSSVIHRDLKPANILLNEDCSLKICDFGLARIVNPSTMMSSATGDEEAKMVGKESTVIDTPISYASPPTGRLTRQLTKHVVTRWYRAPELILIQPYTSAVDIWSLGCILAELLSMQEGSVPGYQDRVPLFPGGSCYPLSGEGGAVKKDERLDQLSVIFGVIGTPDPEDVASIGKANEYIKTLEKQKGKPFKSLFPAADPAALDLLQKMLKFNPRQRCTAEEALEHDFLKGVRRREMEKGADQPLVGPDFLETQKVDLKTLKRRTYEEVLWYKDQDASNVGRKVAETE